MNFTSAAGASLKSQLWNSGKIDLVCEMGSGRARSVRGGWNPPPSARTLEMSLLSQHNDICLAGEIILLFCPGSKGHGCGPENKPLRISETTLTYDGEKERERYSMPLAPCCEIAQRQSKISMADKEGRKEDIKGFAPTTCTQMATKCEDERFKTPPPLLLNCHFTCA